jgi:hypothetical protein
MGLDGVEIFTNSSASHHELRKLSRRIELIKEATLKVSFVGLRPLTLAFLFPPFSTKSLLHPSLAVSTSTQISRAVMAIVCITTVAV